MPGRGSDGPYESEARDRVAGRLARLEAEAAERVAPTPVLHVIQDPGARTRQYLARLLPALAQGDVTRAGAVATTAEPLLERQAARAGLIVKRLPERSETWAARRGVIGACRRTGQAAGARLVHAHGVHSAELAAAVAAGLRVPLVASTYRRLANGVGVSARVRRRVRRAVVPLQAFSAGAQRSFESPVTVIPWGLDRRDLDGDHVPQRVVVELGLDPTTLHFGMAGDLTGPECGGDTFVDAAAIALKAIPFCDYVVVGTGAYSQALQRRAHSLGILGRFRFVEYSRALPRALTAMNLITFPGQPTEFPWEVAEAATSRVPIIAADCPAHREILGDGPGITWVPLGDADALARVFLGALSACGQGEGDRGWMLISTPEGAERVVQSRPSLTGVDISEGEFEAYDMTPDEFSKRRQAVLSRYTLDEAVRQLQTLYCEVGGDTR